MKAGQKYLQWAFGYTSLKCDVCEKPATWGLEYEDGAGFDSEIVEARCEEHYNKKTQKKRIKRLMKRIEKTPKVSMSFDELMNYNIK